MRLTVYPTEIFCNRPLTGYTASRIVRCMATENRGSNGGGALLREWRKGHDPLVTMEALAERLQCTRNYIGMLEVGSARPSLEMAVRISEVTGIPPDAWIPAREPIPA